MSARDLLGAIPPAFFLVHADLPREGPGNEACTARALAAAGVHGPVQVADIGCGPGASTLVLSKLLPAGSSIYSVDYHMPFLESLISRLPTEGGHVRVKTMHASMDDLPFETEVPSPWYCCYYAGYCVGGILAMSDACWLVPPSVISETARKMWKEEPTQPQYPDEFMRKVESLGYVSLSYFILPREAWDAYYDPIEIRIEMLERQYDDDMSPELADAIALTREEIATYKAVANETSYAFYIFKKL